LREVNREGGRRRGVEMSRGVLVIYVICICLVCRESESAVLGTIPPYLCIRLHASTQVASTPRRRHAQGIRS